MAISKKDIPLYKRALSFIKPIWLSRKSSELNPHLELLLYHDRIQLATDDALYSDGKYYTPATEVAKYLRKDLKKMKEVLLLGVGLGSFIDVLASHGVTPEYTLVEKDEIVLSMALDYLQKWDQIVLHPFIDDARLFMQSNTRKFDFIFIDIFESREVPAFVNTLPFLSQCKNCLNKGGKLAMNYIINDEKDWIITKSNFQGIFSDTHIIYSDINRLFIGRTQL